ncbi:sodium:solute symporter family protein [Halomonas huangheensis]|uniref:Sodium:solute symporter n=1 Tax=Halomonas huangheensis TaxID=1178482 RepID=W1N4E2_9GAMM|nr:sodium:solute symporter family protein [Halomonas huangheensis]ALM51569.1 cation acetate symporter [Halomonas huangheensis]ERL50046.1 sodium:solute symporter [Halomonas huangheensis]
MDVQFLTYLFVGASFVLYIGIAIWSRAGSTKDFYVAGGGVPPAANGMATAADWMSAASFISMAGLIAYQGYDASVYLMGWTGGYVMLAMLLAPYLRKFGKFTVPDFIGDRYYSNVARTVAVICVIFVSFTYVAGQMRGTGIVFARFLEVDVNIGVVIGMVIVFFYAVLGGMKGITYTQVAQYCVLITAFIVPAVFLSIMMTGHVLPQTGLGATFVDAAGNDSGQYILDRLDGLLDELGITPYTDGSQPMINVFFITAALMCGTAGLPHVIVRFFTVPRVRDARISAGWALIFIALLYTTAPAVGVFARTNIIETVNNNAYEEIPGWFKSWENVGLIGWLDKNDDGRVQMGAGDPFSGKPEFQSGPLETDGERGEHGQRIVTNTPTEGDNEVYVDRDIIVLANPEIGGLPAWVVALMAAGGVAAALSTAAGLLLVISAAISHDLIKKQINPHLSERGELIAARSAAAVAVVIAGYFGINPPGFVAQVVAFAFGLAASSFFPAILMGIFDKRMNREGAIVGMIVGLSFTFCYIVYTKFINTDPSIWWFGISPEGIGTLGMLLHFVVAFVVSRATKAPPAEIQELVESVRVPRGAGVAHSH